MADVLSHQPMQVGFQKRPVNHAPSPLGFGFGLSAAPSAPSWATSPTSSSSSSSTPHTPLQPWNMAAVTNQLPQVRIAKRRHEHDEDEGKHDVAMDRSPTPERPKRAVPKRARTTPATVSGAKDGRSTKEGKTSGENDVDVGVLLASLPPETLLPLLTSLISTLPTLKPTVLSLIPRPTLATATEAIVKSSKKLLDAYPYSISNLVSGSPSSFGFGTVDFGSNRSSSTSISSNFGFSRSPTPFGSASNSESQGSGMRQEYIVSRLRPRIQDFVSSCFSYLPYFSCIDNTSALHHDKSHTVPHVQSHASALQSQHKDKSHPSETYLFLETLTAQILVQPPLTQSELLPLLMPRLTEEWIAWVDRVDQVVNRDGGMFGQEVVRSWERRLDRFAEAKGDGVEAMRNIRDRWVSKVGWLVGRQSMEEL
ncbi:hypothetical protein BDY19DRAFT_902083 [Irpex rosettiformis]|uniref:Uncharacterized protein n=1 Tax=Irpex rosettiformis TaxID=378272 RepID=A0ACB8UKS6_9APHY|nr:hypothetical protein BDY19DRAFT_902083 [Irpex rosettiformis]